MRQLKKTKEPDVLVTNAGAWLAEYMSDRVSKTKRYRYRHAEIKSALMAETARKCVYCESKVGHNTPGDVEHKIPSSKEIGQHFSWANLTIACTECNRRKRDYYELSDGFLDPYTDTVEQMLEHLGPVVTWRAGHPRGEIFVRILELASEKRLLLFLNKLAKLMELQNVIARYESEAVGLLRDLIGMQISEMAAVSSEYSGMIQSALRCKGYDMLVR